MTTSFNRRVLKKESITRTHPSCQKCGHYFVPLEICITKQKHSGKRAYYCEECLTDAKGNRLY